MDKNCKGEHRFFVADTGFDAEGNVLVILACTSCGEALMHKHKVAPSTQLNSQPKKEK